MPDNEYNAEWPLELCNVKKAWTDVTIPPGGKSQGEGIIIGHLDTGWSEHPELTLGGRYLTSYPASRNFSLSKAVTNIPQKNKTGEDILNSSSIFGGGDLLVELNGHGTSTASVLFSAEGHPNSSGPNFPDYTVPSTGTDRKFVSGVAPKAQVLPQRVSNNVILGNSDSDVLKEVDFWPDYYPDISTYATLAKAIEYCRKTAPQLPGTAELGVISISMGGFFTDQTLTNALINARKAGIIVCAAAGHASFLISWLFKPMFPARSPHVIGVAGCNQEKVAESKGFYGEGVDITAPAYGVSVADVEGDTWESGPRPARNYILNPDSHGTSHSTPFVAGSCALWQAHHTRAKLINDYGKPLLFDVFKHCLKRSVLADVDDWDTDSAGAGIIDVEKLLKCTLPSLSDVKDAADTSGWTEAIRNEQIPDSN